MKMFLGTAVALGAVLSATVAGLAAGRCDLSVRKVWTGSGKFKVSVEAFSNGPDCAKAVVGIVLRDVKGKVLFQSLYAAEYVGTFTTLAEAPVNTGKQMQQELLNWIAGADDPKQDSLSNYPDWKAGADGPTTEPPAEFPFSVSSDVSREDYLQWRSQKLPVLCYVQGIESENCLVLKKDGTVTEIGVQSFPG